MFFNTGYKRVFKIVKDMQKQRLDYRFTPSVLIVTWFFIGRIPIAPGTAASFSVYPIIYFFIISSVSSEEVSLNCIITALIFFVIGLFCISRFQHRTITHDHKSIVIDEIVGQLFTFGIAFPALLNLGVALSSYFKCSPITFAFFLGVITFRFFDIKKPFFIKTADRKIKNAFGVMLDDILAAFFAGFSIITAYKIYDTFLKYYF